MTNLVGIDRLWQVYTGTVIRNGVASGSLFALLFGTLVLWLVFRIIPSQSEKNRLKGRPPLPPGRFGLPVIGETLSFLSAMRMNRPEDFYQTRAEKYGRVFKTSLMGDQTVCMPAPDRNKFVFANENKLVRVCVPSSFVIFLGKEVYTFSTPEYHRHTRLSALENGTLNRLLDAFNTMVEGLMDFPIDIPGTRFWKAKRARQTLLSSLGAITTRRRQELKDKRASPHQDLLSVLLTTPDENGQFLSEEAIQDNLILVMFAGHDTTAVTLSMTLRLLAENPTCVNEILEELRQIEAEREPGAVLNWTDTRHMKYTWRVIQESMRILPVVPLIFREAITDFEFDGFTIPKGWKVIYSSYRSNMVPEYFPEPRKFDPSRFEGTGPPQYTFVPFGGGIHSCPGYELARLVMLVFLDQFVRRLQWSLVHPNEEVTVDPIPRLKKGLLLKVAKSTNVKNTT